MGHEEEKYPRPSTGGDYFGCVGLVPLGSSAGRVHRLEALRLSGNRRKCLDDWMIPGILTFLPEALRSR